MSTYSFAIPKLIINSLAFYQLVSINIKKMFKKFKESVLCLIWLIFVPIAYSIKILSYFFQKIKQLLIIINNKIKNY